LIEVGIPYCDLKSVNFSAAVIFEKLTNAGIPVSLIFGGGKEPELRPRTGELTQYCDEGKNYVIFRWEE
jgi:hypothetical protein